MKKIINVLAFIVIIGFVGAWECGSCDFKTLLFNVGVTLSVVFAFHLVRITLCFIRYIKKHVRVKIY